MKKFQGFLLIVSLLVLIGLATYELSNLGRSFGYRRTEKAFNVHVPDFFEYCGEKVPLHRREVREYFDRELHINAYWHANNELLMRRASTWLPIISQILKEENLPDDLKYIAVVESSLTNSVSNMGAAGFWQLMPVTAQAMGLEVNNLVDERLDVEKSTRAACKYLKQLYKDLGSWTNVLAAYNTGAGAFMKSMSRQKSRNFYDLDLSTQTTRFVYRTMALKEIMVNPEKYELSYHPPKPAPPFQVEEVKADIPDLVQFASSKGVNYRTFRNMNEWLVGDRLEVAKGKTYRLKIPAPAAAGTAGSNEEKTVMTGNAGK
ncbi:lytic transglycosylase domain-containing protein [Rhodoflexus caldus]|uniref:lytic transglycosylase domain-containing protein n=1 Tax=Rhodoflexus caldus TaxID=2891236 RepID=UPI00202A4375|nr:lytic transglycosylase domain-containing protein [Rhodoflexus caldus]